jgi:Superinfection immunity protein
VLPPYLLPTLVAAWRSHHQTAAIFVLNLLLGWTVLGWIIALVWAMTATKGAAAR